MTITHPYHPLHGQPVELVRVRRGVDPDLIVRLPDGHQSAISMNWTDYADEFGSQAVSTHLLDLDGLRQVIQLIDRIRQDCRQNPTGDGAKLAPHQPNP